MDVWRQHNSVVIIPRIEVLENYIWAWKVLSESKNEIRADVMNYLEYEIYKLSKQIYEHTEGITIYMLVESYHNSFQQNQLRVYAKCEERTLNKLFCREVYSKDAVLWNESKLIQAKHCSHYLKKMNEAIHYEVNQQEVEIAKQLQEILKKKLSQKGIIVEINPTSNVDIGEIETLFQHHAYSINHFLEKETNIILCVNSDDPAVFNTNVSNELAYIYYGLMEQGAGKEEAMKWIDKLRENGIQSSFIQILERDDIWLKKLDDLIREMEGDINSVIM